jgi:predicted transcriptional regulator
MDDWRNSHASSNICCIHVNAVLRELQALRVMTVTAENVCRVISVVSIFAIMGFVTLIGMMVL